VFGLKPYKLAAKPRLTSVMRKRNYPLPINIFTGLWKTGESFIIWWIHSSQCERGTFEDQNDKDLLRSSPSVQ